MPIIPECDYRFYIYYPYHWWTLCSPIDIFNKELSANDPNMKTLLQKLVKTRLLSLLMVAMSITKPFTCRLGFWKTRVSVMTHRLFVQKYLQFSEKIWIGRNQRSYGKGTLDRNEKVFCSDREGYISIDGAHDLNLSTHQGSWIPIQMELIVGYTVSYRVTDHVLKPDDNMDYLVISDMDDTILKTGVSSLLKWQVFIPKCPLENLFRT